MSSVPSALVDGVSKLFANRCLTVAAVMLVTYDSVLSFEAERKTIWKTKMSAVKIVYVMYRYLMVASTLISMASSTSASNLSTDWVRPSCSKALIFASICMFLADAVGHCLVIFRTFMLWERKSNILKLLCMGSFVVNGIALAFLILCIRSMYNTAVFIEPLKACSYQIKQKYLLGVWLPQVIFDMYVLVLIIWNAMDRPRLSNQRIWKAAYEDGLILIFATWVVRMINVAFCIGKDDTLPLIAIAFSESLIATINLRLLLRIFVSEIGTKRFQCYDADVELNGIFPKGHRDI